ncbi:hypothetical protein [Nostoc sp.]|uniref:hypothetical protein n=1 Tax=Nostoc sp. TaxID=1180 RepID=UPI002FFD18E6
MGRKARPEYGTGVRVAARSADTHPTRKFGMFFYLSVPNTLMVSVKNDTFTKKIISERIDNKAVEKATLFRGLRVYRQKSGKLLRHAK